MSWSFDTIESWVSTALTNVGYSSEQALIGARSVTWLQQHHAPGVAAMAQHIDFLSAYKLTPTHGGDKDALCPILLSESLQSLTDLKAQTFANVRQPLLLIPCLAQYGGVVQWPDFQTDLSERSFNIEYERKSLRAVLLSCVDVVWGPSNAPSNRHITLATEILPRELVYVKTLQHYAGTLPPPELLDTIGDTDNTSSNS